MTIKTYLAHLEQVKQDLLALDLPENTRLINPPDMGFMSDFGDCSMEFIPKEVFVDNDRCLAYEYLFDKQLTEKENVVVVRSCGYNR
jgi:hypothetical protein